MKTIRLLLTMIILLAGFTGCVKDRGDYDYTAIPVFSTDDWQVKVNDKVAELRADNKIVLKTGDRLCIAANGGFTGNARPEYHWKVLTKDQPDNPEHIFESPREVAVTKDFDQAFEEGPGSYILSFEAINRNNNTIFGAQFIVEVLSIKGMLVYYADADGKGDYSAFATAEILPGVDEDYLGRNDHIYSTVNGGAKIEKPTQIWVREAMKRQPADRRILLASENTVTVVNYETHEKESDIYSSLFFIPPAKEARPEGFMAGFQSEYLVQHGDLYKIDYTQAEKIIYGVHCGQYGCEYSPYMMSVPMDMETMTGGWNIVYNKTLRCFELDNWGTMVGLMSGGGNVDVGNTGMDLLYADKGPEYSIHAVMRDDAGKVHYVCFTYPDPVMDPFTVVCAADHDLSARSEVTEHSLWAVGARGNISFFSSGNEVYLLNQQTGSIVSADLDLPEDAEIAALQVLKDIDNTIYDNALLFVGYNLNGQGCVRQYRFNPLSGQINKDSKREFGEYGRILGIALKK